MEVSVHFHPLEALLQQFRELLAILTFPAAYDGRKQVKPRLFRQGHGAIYHLAHGLAFNRQACGGRIRDADPRPEQAHIVVNLSDSTDRGAGVSAGGFLLNGDGGRQAFNALYIRLLHQLQKLARIGRQTLNIPPLAFGIDRVERQGRLSRSRQARHHHKLAPWNIHVDILQIVFLRAAHADGGQF